MPRAADLSVGIIEYNRVDQPAVRLYLLRPLSRLKNVENDAQFIPLLGSVKIQDPEVCIYLPNQMQELS